MLKECKTERSSARQRLIEDALFDMMRRRSYDEITVTDLCEQLAMPRKAFYRYFDSKDSALVGLVVRFLSSYAEKNAAVEGQPRSLYREMENYFSFWQGNREMLEVLDKNGKLSLIIEISLNFPIDKIISLRRLLPDEEDGMRLNVYRFAIGGLISIMIDWFREKFATPKGEMARLAVRILTKPPFPRLDQFGMSDA
jgi:AcrR family transcriptional regulator